MTAECEGVAEARFLAAADRQRLIDALMEAGHEVHGPVVRDGVIRYEPITIIEELPRGWRDEQQPGRYRLQRQDDERLFAWAAPAHSLKPHVFAPRETLFTARRDTEGRLTFETAEPEAPRIAILGARACDLAGLFLQDKHFLHGPHADAAYRARRRNLFLIAVHCTHPAATCFCAATGDGPVARYGYDLAIGEIDAGWLLTARSEAGVAMLARLPVQEADEEQRQAADAAFTAAARAQTRRLPEGDLPARLAALAESPAWAEVAERCLACGNCTAVCPSCFCHAHVEETDLDGGRSQRLRQWDSCFTARHSLLHGRPVRADIASRYRQWLTHKLAGWHEQYDRSGCSGCGRCITWCPEGIDLLAEATAVLETAE